MRFRWKVTLSTVCLLALLFGAGGSILLLHSFQSSLQRELSSAQQSYQVLLNTLRMADEVGGLDNQIQIAGILDQLIPAESSTWSGVLLTSGGETLFRRGRAVEGMRLSGAAQLEEESTAVCFEGGDGRRYLQLSGCFQVNGVGNTLTIAYDITPIYAARDSQQAAYRAVFLGMMAACLALSYGVSLGLTRPLSRLSAATRAIAGGDLSGRAGITSADEVGQVGRDFDAMAERLEENVLQLRQAMESQERFISSFTHELKTPMTAIIGYADLLRQQTLTPEEQQDAANYIFSEARRLERLSLSLLELQVSKHTVPEMAPVSLESLLQDLAVHLRPRLAGTGIDLSVSWGQGSCRMEPDLVRSLLLNLVDNACRAMPEGGRLTIRGELTEEGCRLTAEDGSSLRVSVDDASGLVTSASYWPGMGETQAMGLTEKWDMVRSISDKAEEVFADYYGLPVLRVETGDYPDKVEILLETGEEETVSLELTVQGEAFSLWI